MHRGSTIFCIIHFLGWAANFSQAWEQSLNPFCFCSYFTSTWEDCKLCFWSEYFLYYFGKLVQGSANHKRSPSGLSWPSLQGGRSSSSKVTLACPKKRSKKVSTKCHKKWSQKTHCKEVVPILVQGNTSCIHYFHFNTFTFNAFTFNTFTFNVTNFELTLTAARRFPGLLFVTETLLTYI